MLPVRHIALALALALGLSPNVAPAVGKIAVLGLFKARAVISIDGKRRILKQGETSPEGVTLIRADSNAAVIEIGGRRRTYELGQGIGTNFAPPPGRKPIRIWPTAQGMYAVVGSINGYPVNFLVDTGATDVAMNRREAKRLGIDYRVEGRPGMSSTAAGIVRTYYVVLRRVKVGEIELTDVEAAIVDGDFPREVLLGNSFLNRLDMRRDGKVLELRRKNY